uniref:(northern house mosquito) hypothetical protein n=1 Tax=Culex pipiens TaxID=7175 RepID=A0A8D8AGK2_CULPI
MLNRTNNKQTLLDRNLMLRHLSLPNKKKRKRTKPACGVCGQRFPLVQHLIYRSRNHVNCIIKNILECSFAAGSKCNRGIVHTTIAEQTTNKTSEMKCNHQ